MSSPHQPGPYDPAAAGQDAYPNPQGSSPYSQPQYQQDQYQPGQYQPDPYQQGQPQYQQDPYQQGQQPGYGQGQYQQPQYQQGQPQYQQGQYQQPQYQQGQPQQTRRPRAPGEGIMGPFTLRDILIFAGALIVIIGSMLPIRHVHIDYTGTDISSWVWHWGAIETIIFLVVAPIVAGVLCLIQKLASGFPSRIGSFSTDQVISGVAIAGAVYNFLFFIAAPTQAYFGSVIILLGSLLVFVAASLTMIPAFASDFAGRQSVEAPAKARAVPHASANNQYQQGQQQYGQQGQYGASNAPQGQYGASNAPAADQYSQPAGAAQYDAAVQDQDQGNASAGFAGFELSEEDRSEYRVADTSESASSTKPYVAGAGAAGAAGTAYVAHEHSAAGEASDSYAHPASTENPIVLGTPDTGSREHTGAHAAVADDSAESGAGDGADSAETATPDTANGIEATDAAADDTIAADSTTSEGADQATAGSWATESAPAEPVAAESSVSTDDSDAEGTTAAPPAAEPVSTQQPFWFAVPEERPAFDESGQPLFAITPGIWFLALEDHGTSFTVRSEDGRVGILHDVSGIQRG